MNIWIMDSNSGVTLLYNPYKEFSVNEDLVSGLLTALNQFTVVEFKQGIESIEMGGLRWVYLSDEISNLLFIAADDKSVSSDLISARLNVIKHSFIEEYVKNEEYWKAHWFGNTDTFVPFKNVIDEYYNQWLTAERVKDIAEFFDILGIFQQILNLLQNVIENHLTLVKKNTIFTKIEKMFDNYANNPYVQSQEELRKINFSPTSGVNIISINPSNCDMMIVEKQIINLIKRIVDLIKEYVDPVSFIDYLRQENVYNYILNNFTLIKELDLDAFLLQLFIG
ncbi:MAG: hypothetical protein ACFFBP_15075 [Promethearchaeota archaeon]